MIRKWQGLNTLESLSVCEPKSQPHLRNKDSETFEKTWIPWPNLIDLPDILMLPLLLRYIILDRKWNWFSSLASRVNWTFWPRWRQRHTTNPKWNQILYEGGSIFLCTYLIIFLNFSIGHEMDRMFRMFHKNLLQIKISS